jgi:hypothetical protein
MHDPRDEARRLIEEGLTVVPAHRLQKHPLVNWRKYQEKDPVEGEVEHWLTSGRYVGCNWAIITGKQVVVVDADSAEAIDYVKKNVTYTPRTVETARGRHFYFKANPDYEITNGVNPDLRIDVRGAGGVVIAPGSVHESGAVYTEVVDAGVDGDWRSLPYLSAQDLRAIDGFNEPKPQPVAGNLNFKVSDAGIKEGSRNNAAASEAGRLIAQGHAPAEILEQMLAWDAINQPPLGRAVIERTVESMLATDASNKARAQVDYKVHAEAQREALQPRPFVLGDVAAIPKREWVYGRHYIRKYLSVTVAPGGAGKTAITIAEAVAMATGKPILGVETTPRKVWVWNLEDPLEELQRRIAAICQHYGITQDDLGDRLLVNSGRDDPLIIAEPLGTSNVLTPAADVLTDHIKALGVDVITVDPFVSSHHLSENDNKAIDMVVKRWAQVANDANCSVELVHHVRKGNPSMDASVSDARGASALVDAARHVRRLQRMTAEEARNANIDESEFWRYSREGDSKDNLAPPIGDSTWRKMVSVDLPNGDNVGVVEPWSWPDAFSDISVEDLRRVQRAIHGGEWREDVRSKTWAGNAVAEALELDIKDASVRSKVKTLISTWVANDALRVVEHADKSRHMRSFVRVGEWVSGDP